MIMYLKWKSIDWFVCDASSLLEGISKQTSSQTWYIISRIQEYLFSRCIVSSDID